MRALAAPHVQGIENIPESRPLLFVGNHSIFGVLDPPLLFAELYERKGIVLRSLGDHLHFQIPGWRDLLFACGAVDGTPEACGALMAARECVLVFPGGGREVAKRKGEVRLHALWFDIAKTMVSLYESDRGRFVALDEQEIGRLLSAR